MAIVVKGKIRLCKTSLADWNPERVNGVLFYERYQEFVKLFSAKIPQVDFKQCFAQPVFNDETNAIEWYCMPMDEYPSSLMEVPDANAEAEKMRIINAIQTVAKTLSENDQKYLNPILTTLESDKVDSITYHAGGKVIFGIWGMIMKKGKVIADVIIDDIKDHRTHHVKYNVKGRGALSFSEIVRKHGHTLGGENDIPTFTPTVGYQAKEWLPESPSGVIVDRPLQFTIVFEKDPNYVSAKDESDSGITSGDASKNDEQIEALNQQTDSKENLTPGGPNLYNVRFTSDERGVVHGRSEYLKKEGERVLQAEIPHVEPKEGYRFVGWSVNPVDHVVNGDTVFTAQYEPVEIDTEGHVIRQRTFWWLSGCLNALLALLLSLLIGLLLWFLLANHNFHFCGGIINDCNCDEDVVVEEEKEDQDVVDPIPTDSVKPVQSVCDATAQSGSNNPESYVFDMGKKSGTFLFEYNTGNLYADKIVVYDGRARNDKIIFNYHGTTGNCDTEFEKIQLQFTNQYILVDVIPDQDEGTCWTIKPHCPN